MMSGFEVKWAHRLAVEVAAYVCTQPGAMPDLPDEMRERVI
jgi:fructokinase